MKNIFKVREDRPFAQVSCGTGNGTTAVLGSSCVDVTQRSGDATPSSPRPLLLRDRCEKQTLCTLFNFASLRDTFSRRTQRLHRCVPCSSATAARNKLFAPYSTLRLCVTTSRGARNAFIAATAARNCALVKKTVKFRKKRFLYLLFCIVFNHHSNTAISFHYSSAKTVTCNFKKTHFAFPKCGAGRYDWGVENYICKII